MLNSGIAWAAGVSLAISLVGGGMSRVGAQTVEPAGAPARQAAGQEAGQAASMGGGNLERVVVTGYVVPRIGDGPQPVVSLDQDFINRQGDTSVSDVLQRLPENIGSFTPTVGVGATFAPAASSVNLQGLGVSSTLVLIDGRRQTPYPFPQNGYQTFVDLNSIPLAAVDRIEVLKDGASAVYGSDAIAGVVNVILKDEYNGADLKTYYGISQRGDDETVHEQFTFGTTHRFNDAGAHLSILGAFDFYENSPIDASSRPYSNNVNHLLRTNVNDPDLQDLTSSRSGAPYFIGETTGNTYRINQGFAGGIPGPNDYSVNTDPYHYQTIPGSQLLPREQRIGGLFKANYQPVEYVKVYDEFSVQRNKENASYTATPIITTDGIQVAANNPFNPFGEDLLLDRGRLLDLGQGKVLTEVSNVRNVVGFTVLNLPKNWFVDASFLYAETDGTILGDNAITRSGLNAAIAGTLPGFAGVFFNPFVDTSTNGSATNERLLNALRYQTRQEARTDLTQWALKGGGELIELPGGPVTLGLGLEYRSESYLSRKDPNLVAGNIVSFGGSSNQAGKDYDRAAYAELTIPIIGGKWSVPGIRTLEVVLAERYDDYSTFGEAWKPKISVRYQPFQDLTFRASYSEGFRAPALSELYAADLVGFQTIADPNPPPQLANSIYDVQLTIRGNPNLQPETSYASYAGFVWSPGSNDPQGSWWRWANGLTVYGDWTEILKHNVIATVPVQFELENPGRFAGSVVRGADGTIQNIFVPYENLGAIRVDSFSFGANYHTKEFNWGSLDAEVDCNYIYHYSQQSLPGGQVLNFTDSYELPDFKMTASLFWSKNVFGMDRVRTGLTLNFIDSEHDLNDFQTFGISLQDFQQGLGLSQVHTIGSWTTLDFQISYTVGKPEEITAETPRPGYGKDGKQILGDKISSTGPSGSSAGWRKWLAGATVTFGINDLADTKPPFADQAEGYDTSIATPFQRFFYLSLEKKF